MAAKRPTHGGRSAWMRLKSRHAMLAARAAQHYSQDDLAALAHCSRAMISHLERGAYETCSPKMAVRIEKALRCQPGELFEPKSLKPRQVAA